MTLAPHVVGLWKKAGQSPLYVSRPVLNAADLIAWAKGQGFVRLEPAQTLHVTVAYSRAPVEWTAAGDDFDTLRLRAPRDGYRVQRLGRDGAVVLMLGQVGELVRRWQQFRDAGASWDFDAYHPHVTLTYDAGSVDLAQVEPYRGEIVLGPERFEPVREDVEQATKALVARWLVKAKSWMTQPRVPAGSPKGGQWTAGSGGAAGLVVPAWFDELHGAGLGIDTPKQARPRQDKPETTDPEFNDNPDDVAVYAPGVHPGDSLNGVDFTSWEGPESGNFASIPDRIKEPPYPKPPAGPHGKPKRLGAGVIIEEPDGRVWIVEPTKHFGGYKNTFPKGGQEPGLTLQQTAIKEAWEESGLRVEITGVLGDYEGDTSIARYYTARRIGGTPVDAGWETQGIRLVPRMELGDWLNRERDKRIAADYGDAAVKKYLARWRLLRRWLPGGIQKAHWEWQTRAPAGTPIGGQWVAMGGGLYGKALAEAGAPFVAKMATGKNPDNGALISANKAIAAYQAAANSPDPVAALAALKQPKDPGPKGNPYTKAKYAAFVEAVAYVKAKQSAAAKQPAGGNAAPAKLSEWKQVGPKPGGSADGGVFRDQNGQLWLVKAYAKGGADQARSEVLAAHLYKAAGAHAPEMQLVDLGGKWGGGIGVASKWVPDVKKLDPSSDADRALAAQDFAADCWLANWDAVGLSYDNIVIANGAAIRIDPGGSLDYRAQGTLKGKAFGDTVGEIETLRDPKVNPQAAHVFGSMTAADIVQSMQKVVAVDDATITSLVEKYGPGDAKQRAALAAKLIARRNDMLAKLNALMPKPQADQVKTAPVDLKTYGANVPFPKAPEGLPDDQVWPFINSAAKVNQALAADLDAILNGSKPSALAAIDVATLNLANAGLKDGNAIAVIQGYKYHAMKAIDPTHGEPSALDDPKDVAAIQAKYAQVSAAYLENIGAKANSENLNAASLPEPPPAPKAAPGASAAGKATGDGGAPAAPVFTGKSADFYAKKAAELTAKAAVGDVEGIMASLYMPKSDKAQSSANYLAYSKHYQAALEHAKAVQGKTGGVTDLTPPAPKEVGTLTPPPAMPAPFDVSKLVTASNPNTKLVAKVQEMDAIAAKVAAGELSAADAAAQIATYTFGVNTYGKKAAAHQANLLAALGGTAAAKTGDASKAAAVATAAPKPEQPTFDPSRLKSPEQMGLDFENWGGVQGKGLSSKPAVNKANNEVVAAIYAVTQTGKPAHQIIADLKALTFKGIEGGKLSDGTPMVAGQDYPISKHPSQHVQGYAQGLIADIEYQLNPPKKWVARAGDPFAALSDAAPVLSGEAAKSADRVGKFLVVGQTGKVDYDSIGLPKADHLTWKNGKLTSQTYAQQSVTNYDKLPITQQSAIVDYTGSSSSSINSKFWEGNPTGKAAAAAAGLKAASVELIPGTTLSRRISVDSAAVKALQASVGKVLQEPAIASTSINPDVFSGNVQFKMVVGPGVKGLYVGPGTGHAKGVKASNKAISHYASEYEVILPPNHRIVIQGVRKAHSGDPDGFGNKPGDQWIVDALVLPSL